MVIFNEIRPSHMCVYCKPFLLVSLKCTDEQGVALLRNLKETKKNNLTLLIQYATAWESTFASSDQIPAVTNCLHAYVILALHPLPASHFVINGSGIR